MSRRIVSKKAKQHVLKEVFVVTLGAWDIHELRSYAHREAYRSRKEAKAAIAKGSPIATTPSHYSVIRFVRASKQRKR